MQAGHERLLHVIMTDPKDMQEQGVKLFKQHDYEAAARLFQQALEAYKAEGKEDMMAEMQVNIGLVHRALGEHQEALEVMKSALEVFQKLEDPLRAAQVLGNLGGVYAALKDQEQAYNCYREAADTFQELGEKDLYGETLLAMGDLQIRDRKITAGAATYQVGLEQLENLSGTQKVIKRLSGFINRLTGSGGV